MTVSRIARKEWLEVVRDGRFRTAAAAVFILLISSLIFGALRYRELSAERAAAMSMDRSTWVGQAPKNPHSAAHFGAYAYKPYMPLSLADQGIGAFTGQSVWMEAHWQNLFQDRAAEDRTMLQRFGELSAATVLQLLIPLVILTLAFDAFAGEKERGTLRQILSLGPPPRALGMGKALGIGAAFMALVVPGSLIGALALILSSAGAGLSPSLTRFVLMALGYAAYLTSFVVIGLVVSAKARTARGALVGLIAFWVFNGLLAPKLASGIAERVAPVPSAQAFWAATRKDMEGGVDGHSPAERNKALVEATLAKYAVSDLKDLPVSFAGISLQEGEEHANDVFDRQFGALWSAYERQDRVRLGFGLLAPFMAARSMSMGFAGSDFEHHKHFAAAAETHRRKLQRFLNGELAAKGKGKDFGYLVGADTFTRTELFEYEAPPPDFAFRGQLPAFAILLMWLIGPAVVLVRATRTIRPE
jgi:ABC-2 type transport system permease protein